MLKVKNKKWKDGGSLIVIMVIVSLGFENFGFRQRNTTLQVCCYALSTSSYGRIAWTSVFELEAPDDCLFPLAAVAEVLSECRLLSYMSQMSMRMSFLFRLINIIHVQTLTQVNS